MPSIIPIVVAIVVTFPNFAWNAIHAQTPNPSPAPAKSSTVQESPKPPPAPVGHLANAADRAREVLESKSRALQAKLAAATAAAFEEAVGAAMAALESEGHSIERQIAVVDAVSAWTAELRGSLDSLRRSGLAESRDGLVQIFFNMSADLERDAGRHEEKAKAATDDMKVNFQRLADACRRLSRAYRANGEHHASVDLATTLVRAQGASEWLEAVSETLMHVRISLGRVEGDAAALDQLKEIHAGVARLQATISNFAGIVEAAAFSPESTIPAEPKK